ncbi:heat shock protein 67B1-like [Protopterus annectens]|uniref:heat shock protein 67B1-like n=1 Tax=Protopterus annectens TaxID=7888 RepID=UPI001CFA62FB|nr:heat shock protein 67B1-like [Protopterus annectens]
MAESRHFSRPFFRDWSWDPFQEVGRPGWIFDQNFGLPPVSLELDLGWLNWLKTRLSSAWAGYSHASALETSSEVTSKQMPGLFWRQLSGGVSEIKKDFNYWKINLDVNHFAPEEISVRVKERFLEISGKHEERTDPHGYISRCFTRRYRLPSEVDEGAITSIVSADGILSVEAPLPKSDIQAPVEIVIPVQLEKPQHLVQTASETNHKEITELKSETTQEQQEVSQIGEVSPEDQRPLRDESSISVQETPKEPEITSAVPEEDSKDGDIVCDNGEEKPKDSEVPQCSAPGVDEFPEMVEAIHEVTYQDQENVQAFKQEIPPEFEKDQSLEEEPKEIEGSHDTETRDITHEEVSEASDQGTDQNVSPVSLEEIHKTAEKILEPDQGMPVEVSEDQHSGQKIPEDTEAIQVSDQSVMNEPDVSLTDNQKCFKDPEIVEGSEQEILKAPDVSVTNDTEKEANQ